MVCEPAELRAARCPVCRKRSMEAFRPFCSKHCANVDLSRWLNGVYAIPVADDDEGGGKPEISPDLPGDSRNG